MSETKPHKFLLYAVASEKFNFAKKRWEPGGILHVKAENEGDARREFWHGHPRGAHRIVACAPAVGYYTGDGEVFHA